MKYILYRHIRLDKNEVFYIGIGHDIKRAFSKFSRNRYWCYIVGLTEYKVDILFDNLSRKEAEEKEIEFIKIYGRKDLKAGTLVNLTDGGTGGLGLKHTDVAKFKMKNRIPINKGIKKDNWSDINKDILSGLSESKVCAKWNCSKGTVYRIKQHYKNG
jgi:hypothetical protein